MARFLTESELRESGVSSIIRGLNSAFLLDIKQDHVAFRELLHQVRAFLEARAIHPRDLVDKLSRLRDELETYFSLEEFYGCFELASAGDSSVARLASRLRRQHREIYLQLDALVERAEQVLYQEAPESDIPQIVEGFELFYEALRRHEGLELDVISQQPLLDLGVGD
jgi:hypothetical protein